MRSLSPTINYYKNFNHDNNLTYFDHSTLPSSVLSSTTATTVPIRGTRRFFLPFRERFSSSSHQQQQVDNNSPRSGQSGPSPTRHPRQYSFQNLFNLRNSKLFSSSFSGNNAKSSSLTSSPTKSALRNLFRGRKSVSFSSPRPPASSFQEHGDFLNTQPNTMDWKQKISTDHTDIAYREAVSRLRSILSPRPHSATALYSKENLDKSPTSKSIFNRDDSPPIKRDRLSAGLRALFPSSSPPTSTSDRQQLLGRSSTFPLNNTYGGSSIQYPTSTDQDDLFNFIEKQAEYISQLEKESNYSKNELGSMLSHVRQVISENELLHEKQKQDLFSSMIQQLSDKTDDRGDQMASRGEPGKEPVSKSQQLMRDSRVAELEAQLNQNKRTLRSAQEEILDLRRNLTGNTQKSKVPTINIADSLQTCICEEHSAKIDGLTRDNEGLVGTLTKLKEQISELRDREIEATKKVKSSLEIVEQMQMEKEQSDLETRRVKDELDRHQQRVRELIQEHSRKLYDEKLHVENKYRQEIDLLNNEMTQEMDSVTKTRLDLERQKRTESELRRELQLRMSTIDDLRQEMQIKMNHLQGELSQALQQKSKGEQDLINSRLQLEKLERDSIQEVARLHAEINGTKRRLEDSETDLHKCQAVIAKLNENISHMQHENSLARIRLEERGVAVPFGDGTGSGSSGDVVSMIQIMEDKHSHEMTELEQLVHVQNDLLNKLRGECKLVTDKLEQTSNHYKKEKQNMYAEKERLKHLNKLTSEKHKDLEYKVQHYKSNHEQMTERVHRLEEDDKSRSDRIFQLLSKQSGFLKENQNLQNEIALLKCKIGASENDDDGFKYSSTDTSRSNRGIH